MCPAHAPSRLGGCGRRWRSRRNPEGRQHMSGRARQAATAAALLATMALTTSPTAPAAASGPAPAATGAASVVLEWNRYAERSLNRLETAMAQGAVYDAVNAITGTHQAYLTAPAADGRGTPRQPVSGTAPGQWRPTPPNYVIAPTAFIGDVRPFLIPGAESLRTPGPNPLTSQAYATDFEEVRQFGAAGSPA